LERTQGELRMNGVIVLSNINGRALTDPRYRPFFIECDRRRVCVFIHPMIPASAEPFSEFVLGPIIGFPFDTTLAVARLCYAGVFRELPNIRWILGHLGGAVPYLMERMDNGYRDFAECRVNIDERPSVSRTNATRNSRRASPRIGAARSRRRATSPRAPRRIRRM